MNHLRSGQSFLFLATMLSVVQSLSAQTPQPQPLSDKLRQSLTEELKSLKAELGELSNDASRGHAAIFAKGLEWALDYDKEFTPNDVKLLENAIPRCRQRIAALKEGKSPWMNRSGKIALGYISEVDNSVQPYGLIIPKNYDGSKPIRLDVVLHGSQKPVGMVELRFIGRFDEGDDDNPNPPEVPFIELHPLGRVENCYRWAGETDVFEAISDVCRRFNIDTNRMVLRGMSMGASGTWHLGLKHPDRFVSLGPYCGYVDTHKFSETPIPHFVKVGPLPEHQELGLHMLDSVDYAANAGVVPVVAAMGEKDIFFDAHVIMGAAMKKEGLEMVNLISPGTGHVIDPKTHAEQMRRIAEYADKGLNRSPESIRFVTWTLKYSRCHWLQIVRMNQHYHRAEISAKVEKDRIVVTEPTNIDRFAINMEQLPAILKAIQTIQIGTTDLSLSDFKSTQLVGFQRQTNEWVIAKDFLQFRYPGKSPGRQGPIDDAFTSPFVCVRGTGTPWNPAVHAYAEDSLQRFAREWRQYFRGELPVKNDSDITDRDIQTKNLILFGDPGSNSWIAKFRGHFAIDWTKDLVKIDDQEYASMDHVPSFIMPNPRRLETGYVVINSGHTFRGADLGKINYLIFPRWGDWAVLKIDPDRPSIEPVTEEVIKAGYFDEEWKLPK